MATTSNPTGPTATSQPSGNSASTSLKEARAASVLSDWKLTPATMMARLDPSWIPAKWLQYLSLAIAQTIAQGNCGLLISAPPRHGKSRLSTIATPLWSLENFPHKNVIVGTYGEELSTDFSREIRDFIQNNQHLLDVRLRHDTQRVSNFLTTKGGGLKAVGLKGAITGRGADVFVIDDYIKNEKEAMSPSYLEDLWNWWKTVARTRLEPGAVVIILATRWVNGDLIGRIKKHQAQTGRRFFRYIELPAIAEPSPTRPDPIGRAPGQVLFPERYNKQAILDLKTDLGSRWFNAMFQQDPLSDEDVVINLKWFKKISQATFHEHTTKAIANKQVLVWGRYWDLASTARAGDFTAGALALYNKATEEFYMVGLKRGQWSAGRVEDEFTKTLIIDHKRDKQTRVGMEQEPGSSGKYSIRHFKGLAREALPGTSLRDFSASTSSGKMMNAQPFLAAAEAGKVYIVTEYLTDELLNQALTQGAELETWIKDWEEEAEPFPEGDHDDIIDAFGGCYKMLSGKKGITASIGRKAEARQIADVLANSRSGQTTNGQPAVNGLAKAGQRSGVTFGRGISGYRPQRKAF